MNTTTTARTAPQALIAPAARIATALAVMAAVTLAWTGVQAASHDAVNSASAQFATSRIQLPTVVVTGKRDVDVARLPTLVVTGKREVNLASAAAARAAL